MDFDFGSFADSMGPALAEAGQQLATQYVAAAASKALGPEAGAAIGGLAGSSLANLAAGRTDKVAVDFQSAIVGVAKGQASKLVSKALGATPIAASAQKGQNVKAGSLAIAGMKPGALRVSAAYQGFPVGTLSAARSPKPTDPKQWQLYAAQPSTLGGLL